MQELLGVDNSLQSGLQHEHCNLDALLYAQWSTYGNQNTKSVAQLLKNLQLRIVDLECQVVTKQGFVSSQ
ncbi:hypothetical protein D3C78_1948490 [compost metagenome]